MAVLSFFMLRPEVRQLTPSDLDPVKVWTAAENRASRVWERGVKSYENMRLVYEIQTRLEANGSEEAPAAQRRGPEPRNETQAAPESERSQQMSAEHHRRLLPRLRKGAGGSRRAHGPGAMYCKEHAPHGRRFASSSAVWLHRRIAPGLLTARTASGVRQRYFAGLAFVAGLDSGSGRDLQRAIRQGSGARDHDRLADLDSEQRRRRTDFEPLVALMLVAFWVYMPFEAYHTARNRQMGQPVDEFSSLVPHGAARNFPIAPVILIGLGTAVAAEQSGDLRTAADAALLAVLLIGAGVYMLLQPRFRIEGAAAMNPRPESLRRIRCLIPASGPLDRPANPLMRALTGPLLLTTLGVLLDHGLIGASASAGPGRCC